MSEGFLCKEPFLRSATARRETPPLGIRALASRSEPHPPPAEEAVHEAQGTQGPEPVTTKLEGRQAAVRYMKVLTRQKKEVMTVKQKGETKEPLLCLHYQ